MRACIMYTHAHTKSLRARTCAVQPHLAGERMCYADSRPFKRRTHAVPPILGSSTLQTTGRQSTATCGIERGRMSMSHSLSAEKRLQEERQREDRIKELLESYKQVSTFMCVYFCACILRACVRAREAEFPCLVWRLCVCFHCCFVSLRLILPSIPPVPLLLSPLPLCCAPNRRNRPIGCAPNRRNRPIGITNQRTKKRQRPRHMYAQERTKPQGQKVGTGVAPWRP